MSSIKDISSYPNDLKECLRQASGSSGVMLKSSSPEEAKRLRSEFYNLRTAARAQALVPEATSDDLAFALLIEGLRFTLVDSNLIIYDLDGPTFTREETKCIRPNFPE